MGTVTRLPSAYSAADLQDLVGDQIQDRFNASKWNTVLSITDGRPGRVWVLYTDGRCIIEDVADLLDLGDYEPRVTTQGLDTTTGCDRMKA